ncbi:MAG: threonine ammonia-lyase [Candidatus Dormibacter sp.]|uniref:threonine ammonia-lyase n=1 Tax=Candidatus Dormibacter sp. TaxID=2973982 RepID=UPI00268DCCD9
MAEQVPQHQLSEKDPAPADNASFLREQAELIAQAAERIQPHIRRTPALSTDLDQHLRLKPECFQVTGSFKVRGAFNAVLKLHAERPETKGVIAVSSGNHAQALALAARTVGLRAVILIPEDANPAKVAATRSLGAEVIQHGITFANREEKLREAIGERGLTLIHPFDDWNVVHGQATAARELLEDEPELQTLAVPTGGGGLLSGTALSAKIHNPELKVIGVEPESADDAARSFRTGSIQSLREAPTTLADGVRTTAIGSCTYEVAIRRRLVDDIVTVSESEIAEATRAAWLKLKLALEPTGALPLAAYLAGKLPGANRRVGLLLSGGNFEPATIARLLATS